MTGVVIGAVKNDKNSGLQCSPLFIYFSLSKLSKVALFSITKFLIATK